MSNNNYDELKFVLIEKVRSFPAIWDKNHKHHHNRYVLHRFWKGIAVEAGMGEDRIKKMWRNLRQEFGKQVKKIHTAGRESLESANPQWPFFQPLMFLKDQFVAGDDNPTEVDVDPSESFDEFEGEFNYESQDMSPTPLRSRSPSIISETLPQQNGHGQYMMNYNSRKRMRQEEDPMRMAMIQFEKEKLEMQRQRQNSDPDHRDEDVGFFNSLLPHVRQLHPQQKMVFRLRVQQQLYELMYGPYDPHQRMQYSQVSNQGEPLCTAVYANEQ